MTENDNKPLEEEVVDGELLNLDEEKFDFGGETKPESKVKKLVRQVGIWALAFLGFGLLIFLLVYFLMVRPATLNNQVLTESNTAMETQLAEYRDELDAVTSDLDQSTETVATLGSTVDLYEKYSAYNKLLNNLAQMQKAVIMNDTVSKRVALANAQENLDKLEVLLMDYDASLVELLQERLTYLATTDGDADEVYQEVETMYVYLLELQETLFGDLY